MKFEVKKAFLVLPLVAALAACGGGGGGSDSGAANANQGTTGGTTTGGTTTGGTTTGGTTTGGTTTGGTTTGGTTTGGTTTGGTTPVDTTPPAPPTNPGSSGAVSSPYVATATSRYIMLGWAEDSVYLLSSPVAQQNDGAVVQIADKSLTGDLAVRDIAGDQNFALGRWAFGTVRRSVIVKDITTNDTGYHYVVFNGMTAFPSSGTYTCDAGTFTTATRNFGSGSMTVASTGTASISFSASGATVQASVESTGNNARYKVSTPTAGTVIQGPDYRSVSGGFNATQPGLMLTLGEGGNGKVRLMMGFQTEVGGSDYRGIGVFTCSL